MSIHSTRFDRAGGQDSGNVSLLQLPARVDLTKGLSAYLLTRKSRAGTIPIAGPSDDRLFQFELAFSL